MKILLLLLLISCGQNNIAQATFTHHVALTPVCHHSRAFGECRLTNTTAMAVTCSYHVTGRTLRGSVYKDYVFVVLYPGAVTEYYVYANSPAHDPLVYLSSTAHCYLLGDLK